MNEEQIKILEEFENKLIKNQEDLDPEFTKIIDEHFWELV